jgi:hypothetical protein
MKTKNKYDEGFNDALHGIDPQSGNIFYLCGYSDGEDSLVEFPIAANEQRIESNISVEYAEFDSEIDVVSFRQLATDFYYEHIAEFTGLFVPQSDDLIGGAI